MQYKNSYIFLKRENIKNPQTKTDNEIVVDFSTSFRSLLIKTFKNITFDDKKIDFSPSGTITIFEGKKAKKLLFKYHNVGSSYYLDIIIDSKNKISAINLLEKATYLLIGKNNVFDKYFVSIVSYDYVSEYYCNKIYPLLNEFERKLRKLLFIVYTFNFNMEYYTKTTSKELQENLNYRSKILNKELNEFQNTNISKSDYLIKYGFYSLEYSDIDKLLFTRYNSKEDVDNIKEILDNNKDLSKLGDKFLRKTFELLKPKSDWERFFENKKIDKNFQKILDDIRKYRNNIAHCKFISKKQYNTVLQLLKQNTKSLNTAISIIECKDFFDKNLELYQQSFNRISKVIGEIVINSYKPLMDNIEIITKPMIEFSEKLKTIINPISEMISNIDFPEIESSKYIINDNNSKNDK